MSLGKEGSLPSLYALRSAARVLRVMGREQQVVSAVRESYRTTPSGGILSPDGLLRAEKWLVRVGLLKRDHSTIAATPRSLAMPNDEIEIVRELVRISIMEMTPAWVNTVVSPDGIRAELLPIQVESVLDYLFEPSERDAILRSAAAKYDESILREIGDAGERAVVMAFQSYFKEIGRLKLAKRVRQVSLISDALGYDVSTPNLIGQECHVEVKCFRGRHPKFFLTRNEFEVGIRLERWYLVICQFGRNSSTKSIGWTTAEKIGHIMPVDATRAAKWRVVEIRMPESELSPGLPIVCPSVPSRKTRGAC